MAAEKPYLSRQYVYAPLANLNVDLSTATLHKVAFMTSPTVEPADVDWLDAIVVTTGHALYDASIGDALAILVGPARGDAVTTEDLAAGSYTMWSDWSIPGSDERNVDWHGTVTIVTAPEA